MSGRTTTQGYTGDSVRQHFTGYEADAETGLNFAEARYQSSVQGRFTSIDPLDESAYLKDPQSFNRYSYVENDPINSTDPEGLMGGEPATYLIDGMPADSGMAIGLLRMGAAVLGPLNSVRYDSKSHRFVEFTAIASSVGTAVGYIPKGAKYIGGLCWGLTDEHEPWASYTYTFTEDRLSQLTYQAREFEFEYQGVYRNVYGKIVGEKGIDMHPAVDPVWFVAGLAEGIDKALVEEEVEREVVVKSSHFFARHFAETGLTEAEVNAAIRQSVRSAVRGASSTGQFWGKAVVRGQLIEYRAFTVAGRIEVATAYPWPID